LARLTRGATQLRLFLIVFSPTFWLSFFLVLPLGFVALYGLSWYDDSYILQIWPFDPTNYQDAVSLAPDAVVIPLLLRTFGMAALTTVVSLALGYIMAYYIARLAREKWRGLLMGLVVIPFWVSFVVRIYAVFPFTNTGDEGLTILAVWTSCGCTSAHLVIGGVESPHFGMHDNPAWTGRLAPGASATLVVLYDANEHPDLYVGERSVFVRTDDPGNPEFEFRIRVAEG